MCIHYPMMHWHCTSKVNAMDKLHDSQDALLHWAFSLCGYGPYPQSHLRSSLRWAEVSTYTFVENPNYNNMLESVIYFL